MAPVEAFVGLPQWWLEEVPYFEVRVFEWESVEVVVWVEIVVGFGVQAWGGVAEVVWFVALELQLPLPAPAVARPATSTFASPGPEQRVFAVEPKLVAVAVAVGERQLVVVDVAGYEIVAFEGFAYVQPFVVAWAYSFSSAPVGLARNWGYWPCSLACPVVAAAASVASFADA